MKNQNKIKETVNAKKIYKSPELTVFGSIKELTQGGATSSMSDSGQNSMWTS